MVNHHGPNGTLRSTGTGLFTKLPCTIRYRLFTLALFIIPTTYLLLTMPQTLYHRTTIGDARAIVKDGFENQKWRFENDDGTGEVKKAVGVWLSDRPLDGEEGPPGDAILEVDMDASEESLELFQLEGVVWEARLWIVPAEVVNARSKIRILQVDPRSSWFHEKPDLGDED